MPYAIGKQSRAVCDRCGQGYRYEQLRKEWQGLKTCPECWEAKHPQLGPFRVPREPQAIYQPRPDRKEPLDVPVGENVVYPPWREGSLHGTTSVGIVTVVV